MRTRSDFSNAGSNDDFIDHCYRLALGRPADSSGKRFYRGMLESGVGRDEVVYRISTSDESINRLLAASFVMQDLRELRPDRFRDAVATDGKPVPVFDVESAEDFDWLEHAILEYGYYEKPGIWSLGVDEDKRRMAAMLSLLRPQRCLEIGCSSGAVVSCLLERGIAAEGVEISAMAIRRAAPETRQHIHHADLLTLELPRSFDLVYGLDVFEHFNPNRLDEYLACVAALTSPGGLVFVNVPTWGEDRVYGTIWEPYLSSWQDDLARNRLFRSIEVDAAGYPVLGHLVWAGSRWWEERFEEAGLHREPEVERALHQRFDAELAETPARKAFYVFSRAADSSRLDEVIAGCRTSS